jgi:hypothetical protein
VFGLESSLPETTSNLILPYDHIGDQKSKISAILLANRFAKHIGDSPDNWL